MTANNLQPVPLDVVARTRDRLDRLYSVPGVAVAAEAVEAAFAERSAEIAANPDLRSVFDSLPPGPM